MGRGSLLASAFGHLFSSGQAAEEQPGAMELQQQAWEVEAPLGGPKRKVPGAVQPSDAHQGGRQGWGDLRRSKRFCSADDLAELAGASTDAPQDQAFAQPAAGGWGGGAPAPAAASAAGLHAPAASDGRLMQEPQRPHGYDLRSGSGGAGAGWQVPQRPCPPLHQQQQAQQAHGYPAPHAALPPRYPQQYGGQQQQQKQPEWGARNGGTAGAGYTMSRFSAAMPQPAAAAGLAGLLPRQPLQPQAAVVPQPRPQAGQQAGLQPAFAHLPGFAAAPAPRAALPGYVVQRVLPAPAAAGAPPAAGVPLAPQAAAYHREEESQEEAWDCQTFLTASEGSLTDDGSPSWPPPSHPHGRGASFRYPPAAPTPPPSPAAPPASTAAESALLAATPPRQDRRRQELVQQLREANAALEGIALPEPGCAYIPLHESDALLEPAFSGYCIPPIAVALGGSYFARLLHQSPEMQAQAVASGFLVRVPVRASAAPGARAPAILMLRSHAGNASLFSIFATCVYLAAKVADRVQYQRELSSLLSALLGRKVSTQEAEATELGVLQALRWRLGPVYNLRGMGPY